MTNIRRRTIELTPELAQHYLNNRYDGQRKLNPGYAASLARDIRAGRWNNDAHAFDPIMCNRKGEMVNGQHRCKAVVDAGKSITVDVLDGIPDDLFKYMDGVKTRNVKQFIKTKNASVVASVGRYANAIESGMHIPTAIYGKVETVGHSTTTSAGRIELLAYIEKHSDHLERCAKEAQRIYDAFGKAGSKGMFASALWTISYLSGYDTWAEVESFVDDIVADTPSHPALASGKTLAVKKIVAQLRDRNRIKPDFWLGWVLAMYRASSSRKRTLTQKDVTEAITYFDKLITTYTLKEAINE